MNVAIVFIFSWNLWCNVLDGNLTLWEWNLDAMLIERIVDALHDDAIVGILREHIDPYQYLEGDAVVIKALQDHLHTLLVVDAVELGEVFYEQFLHLLHIAAVSHTYFQNVQLITMVASHVLVVLREELGILEGDDRTIDCLQHRRGIADTAYLSSCTVTDDIVAYLHTSHHQGDAIVDILQDVLGCKT